MRVSTLGSLLRALGATFADIAGPDAPEVSAREVAKRVKAVGVPSRLFKRFADVVDPRDLVDVVARGFGWEAENIVGNRLVPPRPTVGVRLKRRADAGEQ